jgi:DNA-binding SARP family transcriptional activator/tetratricopeptide (TPR) repeat protein
MLGPLEAFDDERRISLGGMKQRAFLAVLLLHPNALVSKDRLSDDLWGEEPPATATHSLEVYASSLRKALRRSREERPIITARSSGYILEVDPDDIDSVRFEQLSRDGRDALVCDDAAAASDQLRAALALWHGPALADFAYERFAQAEIARLDDLRIATVEDRIEADLRLGHHPELVGELRAHVADHPLRERLIGQLMLALYRSGRQSAALDVYRMARERLAEELGIDPGAELRSLETAILRQADDLMPTLRTPEAPEPILVGPEREVRKVVTAISTRVALVTPSGDSLDPERLRRILERTGAVVREATLRSDGQIGNVGGDVVLSLFGVPRVHEDDALRAVRAAAEIRDGMVALEREFADEDVSIVARSGIDTAEVVMGEESQLVAGGIEGSAGLLERAAEPGEILMSERTHRLVRDAVAAEAVERPAEPVAGRVFALVSITPYARGFAPRRRATLVDRDEELALLRRILERTVRTRACHLFTVVGTAGVGKSRLVEEFLAEAARSGSDVVTGHCLPFGDGITFWPIVEAVRAVAGIADSDGIDEARRKIDTLVSAEPDRRVVAERVAQVVGLSYAPLSPGETAQGVRRLLESLARERPLVLLVEDLHWAEPTLLDLIAGLIDRSSDAPILILCTARVEFLDEHRAWGGGKTNAGSVLLPPLSDDDGSELLRRLAGGSDLPADVASRILEVAEGNALFLEQTLSMLIDAGLLFSHGEGWTVVGDIAPIPIPPTIQALLAARLDQLTSQERSAIQRAAVIGKEFAPDDIAGLLRADEATSVDQLITSLVEKEWIRRDRNAVALPYRFRHVLMQGVAYDSIPKLVRAELHERFGDRLEATSGERIAEQEELIGHHLSTAVRYRRELNISDDVTIELARRAGRRLGAAGDRAFLRGDMPAAVSLLSSAASLLRVEDVERIRLLPRLGTAMVELGRFADADAMFDDAWERASAAGDVAIQAETLYYRSELRAWLGVFDPDQARMDAKAMIPALEEAGLHTSLARCWRVVAISSPTVEGYAEAAEHAMESARQAGDRLSELEILQNLADVALALDQPVQKGLDRCDELLAIADDDRVATAAIRVIGRGPLLAVAGRFEEARGEVGRALDTFEELGLALWLADAGTAASAEVELLAGNTVAAERWARQGLEALNSMGATGSAELHAGLLARALHEQGRFEDAEASIRTARARGMMTAASIEAMLMARRRSCEAAETLARSALDADLRMAQHNRLLVSLELAQTLYLCGHTEEAVTVANDVLDRAAGRGDVPSAGRARSLLVELAASR